MPQVQSARGGELSAAKIVTVTWAGDPSAPTIQDFDDKLGASSFWSVLAEYGVGAATSGPAEHVVVQTPLQAGIDENAIDAWVQQQAANPAASGWPAPDAQTVYAVYVPPSVNVTYQGQDACLSGDGYHVELQAGSNPAGVAYALILEGCYTTDGLPLDQDTTETGSHEIAEAATDPYPNNAPALGGFDADHLAWELWDDWQDEIADACEYFDEGFFQGGADEPYWLSRLWSNASARAGHDPCVPTPAGPYGNVTPLGLDSVDVHAVDAFGKLSSFTTKGWRIAPGQTRTVQVGFYSDAPMDAWAVTPVEGDCCTVPWTNVLTVSPTSFSGQNGDVVDVAITVNQAPAQGTAALLSFVSAAAGGVRRYMAVVVGTY
jgi:hypothetical protein